MVEDQIDDENKTPQESNVWKILGIGAIIVLILTISGIIIYALTKSDGSNAWDGMTKEYMNQVKQAQSILSGYGVRVRKLASERSNCYDNIIVPNTPLDESMFNSFNSSFSMSPIKKL